MTREEIKEAAKVMEAYADGKKVQKQDINGLWIDCDNPMFDWASFNYRIKPGPKYRPFKNQEECWNEMHKHSNIGWIINKSTKSIYHINVICHDEICLDETSLNYYEVLAHYEFLDGTPFGIKE